MPAWKVIADCSVGSVQCASLVLFVSNQSSKFPALSGVGYVNLHARLFSENDPIYQISGYLCVILFCWGRIVWMAIYKLAWEARFYMWYALSFSAVYGVMWHLVKNFLSFQNISVLFIAFTFIFVLYFYKNFIYRAIVLSFYLVLAQYNFGFGTIPESNISVSILNL